VTERTKEKILGSAAMLLVLGLLIGWCWFVLAYGLWIPPQEHGDSMPTPTPEAVR
jgi:CHASE2 domain-containing sensor protein